MDKIKPKPRIFEGSLYPTYTAPLEDNHAPRHRSRTAGFKEPSPRQEGAERQGGKPAGLGHAKTLCGDPLCGPPYPPCLHQKEQRQAGQVSKVADLSAKSKGFLLSA